MIYICVNGESSQSPYACKAKKKFLLQAVLPISAIELVCNDSVLRKVLLYICIQQVELYAANIHSPQFCIDVASRECNRNQNPLAICIKHRLGRCLGEILRVVLCNLVSLR